ncbi:Abi family protein [Salinicoccus albus]|uniref:Abi family protein n=1 Tax=Salinicoccus albus TaxID=418756 RepID=UPI00035E12F7|nr:Abi family protein [Salinicoccus albus]
MSSLDEVPFLHYQELIEEIKDKNILIHDELHAKLDLKNHSYYTLLNGYKRYFLEDGQTDRMIEGTTFDDFTDTYYLYSDISSLVFKYILYIEKSLRSRLAHIVAREFGVYRQEYLFGKNYIDYKNLRYRTLNNITDLIDNCKETSVTHYFKHSKKNVPPWIVVQDISFNDTISWANILPKNLKEELLKDYFSNSLLYKEFHEAFFHHSFNFLREYRNIAAHGKRDFKEKIRNYLHRESSKHFFGETLLSQRDLHKNRGTQDLLGVINLILKYTQDKKLLHKFLAEFILILSPYVNMNDYSANVYINGMTVYEILDLPENIMERVSKYLASV